MNDSHCHPRAPLGSSLQSVIAAVFASYQRIEADQRAFLAAARDRGCTLACPGGCGFCCDGFVPDVLPSEAAYMAAWLLENNRILAREASAWAVSAASRVPPCPLLKRTGDDGGASCSAYPARPLVCRLFGAAGVRDKEGRASFRPCARMPLTGYPSVGEDRLPILGADLIAKFGILPPIMADYSAELASLNPGDAADRTLITEALPIALERVGLCLSLAEGALDRTYSKPNERKNSAEP